MHYCRCAIRHQNTFTPLAHARGCVTSHHASSQLTKPTESAPVVVVARDPTAELAEVMDFFRFAVKPNSTWSGTAVFDIWKSELNPRLVISIRVHPDRSVETWFGLPPDGRYTCYSECSRDDFFLVYSGAASPAAVASMVLTGRIRVRWFRYLDVQNFGLSYDFSTPCWVSFYRSRGETLYADQLMLQHWRRLEPKGLFIDENGNVVDPKTVSPERAAELLAYCRRLESTPAVTSAAKSASIVTSSAAAETETVDSTSTAVVSHQEQHSTPAATIAQPSVMPLPEPAAPAAAQADADSSGTTVVDEVASIVHANASRMPADDVSVAVEMSLLMRQLLENDVPSLPHIQALHVPYASWPVQRADEVVSRCFAVSPPSLVIPAAAPRAPVAHVEEEHVWDRFTSWLRGSMGLTPPAVDVPAPAAAPSSFDLDAAAERHALHRNVAQGCLMAAYASGSETAQGAHVRTWVALQPLHRARGHGNHALIPASVAAHLSSLRRAAVATTARAVALSADVLRPPVWSGNAALPQQPDLPSVDAATGTCASCIDLDDVDAMVQRRCMTTAELLQETSGPALSHVSRTFPASVSSAAQGAHDRLRAFATDMAASMDMRSAAHTQGVHAAQAAPPAEAAQPIIIRAARHLVAVTDGVTVDVDELAASTPMPDACAALYTPVTRAWVSPIALDRATEDASHELAAERDTLTYIRHVRAAVQSCAVTVASTMQADPSLPPQPPASIHMRSSSWTPLAPPPPFVALTGTQTPKGSGVSRFMVTPDWMNTSPRTPCSISGMCAAVLRACTQGSEALSLAHAETMLWCLGAPLWLYKRPLVTLGAAQAPSSTADPNSDDVDVFLLPVWHPRRLYTIEQGNAIGSDKTVPGAHASHEPVPADDGGPWATSKHTPTAYLGYGAHLFAATARASARVRYDHEAVEATVGQMMRAARGDRAEDNIAQLAPWLTGPFSDDEMGLSTESLARGFADAVRHMTHRIKDSRMMKMYRVDGGADGERAAPRSDVLRRIRRRILGVKGDRGDDADPPPAVHVPGFGLANVGKRSTGSQPNESSDADIK